MRRPWIGWSLASLFLSCGAAPTPPIAKTQGQPNIQVPAPPAATDPNGLPSLAPLVQRVRGTVVGVTTTAKRKGGGEVPPEVEEFWRRFFGRDAPPFPGAPEGPRTGLGSGVIIDPSGLVLTNNHVVEGADEVRVKTSDETEYEAEVVGTDPETDIAVIRLKGVKTPLAAATLGSSDALRVGDFVVAIGNPFGLELTVTSGIVSAKARIIGAGPYDDFLQTDAAINPGNSGGPLFDLSGQVVGINTAIVASGAGIGFAVPIDLIKAFLPQLQDRGRVVRGYLGVGVQDLTPELAAAFDLPSRKGALVSQVQKDAPAKALEPGDLVVGMDGQPVASASDLTNRVAQVPPDTKVTLEVIRKGKPQRVQVKLGERPRERPDHAPSGQQEQEGALGLQIQPLPPELRQELGVAGGVLVVAVEAGSRAEEAGLMPGDVILEAQRRPVAKPDDLLRALRDAGDKAILLRVARGQGAIYVLVPAA